MVKKSTSNPKSRINNRRYTNNKHSLYDHKYKALAFCLSCPDCMIMDFKL